MRTLADAIDDYRTERLSVYNVAKQEIIRNANRAKQAAKDHVGRWLFELLQNSDDAGATKVRILVEGETVYVADNGSGLKPNAVSAICGTDLSDKVSGTIGRKGVGFKSVYEVSSHPMVLTVNDVGIEFSPEKTREWLKENGFTCDHVPYQWIPFAIGWDEAAEQDLVLREFGDFRTVVVLRKISTAQREKVEKLLKEWEPYALLAFRHVRCIAGTHLNITLKDRDNVCELIDDRRESPIQWHVKKQDETVPEEFLTHLDKDDREAVVADGVSILVAAPLKDNLVVRTEEELPVYVFYPTEQLGPVRLLLHAEFLVKGDRTAIIPIEEDPLNNWLARRLAAQICEFVNREYNPDAPSNHVALLVPFEERASHPLANALWQLLLEEAKVRLRLPDINGNPCLTIDEARLLSVSVRPDLARALLASTRARDTLLHCDFDENQDAQKAVEKLGCAVMRDSDLIQFIADNAASKAGDREWICTCWEWLAAWAMNSRHETSKRIEQVKDLSIVPVDGQLIKMSEHVGRIVTWRTENEMQVLPGWLPLDFVDEWFRDFLLRIQKSDGDASTFIQRVGIGEPGDDVVQRALGNAINDYWKEPKEDPGRFLQFLLSQDWHETSAALRPLMRCPVRTQTGKWVETQQAYFGRSWGNDLLADLFADSDDIAWVQDPSTETVQEKLRAVLLWLGVAEYPRLIQTQASCRLGWLSDDCNHWLKYLQTPEARDAWGRAVGRIAEVTNLAHVSIRELSREQSARLLLLVAKHWEYYRDNTLVRAEGTKGQERNYRPWQVSAKWWWEVCEELPVPMLPGYPEQVGLINCWVPDRHTKGKVGKLIPVLDTQVFGEDEESVKRWLVETVHLRTRLEQISESEWKKIVSSRIPSLVPVDSIVDDGTYGNEKTDQVAKWYDACLETVAELEEVQEQAFKPCPLLCRKGPSWRYICDEPRYISDDNDLAKAFENDIWFLNVPARVEAAAIKYFGVRSLSKSVHESTTFGGSEFSVSPELLVSFKSSLPYIWAWRSSRTKQGADGLCARLKTLEPVVVRHITAKVRLDGIDREFERHFATKEDKLFLQEDRANETVLAKALAQLIGVRSEADFYENLFRCKSDHAREEKLIDKGMRAEELQRCLREFSGEDPFVPPEETPPEENPPTSEEEPPSPGPPGSETPSERPRPGTEDRPRNKNHKEESPEQGDERPEFKDPDEDDYVLKTDPQGALDAPGGTGAGGGGGGGERTPELTQAEKLELEEVGRGYSQKALEEMGYEVTAMPQQNPGFDLLARKPGEELHVEVKAHMGSATVVEVTRSEYEAYREQQGYRWELWNVEHLSEKDSSKVVITRYDDIPESALTSRAYQINLKECGRVTGDSAHDVKADPAKS